MASERLANIGYMAVGKETTKGVAVTPSVYLPLYEDDMKSDINADQDMPIIGNALARRELLMGMRNHMGNATVLAEPNTAAHLLNMLLVKGNTTDNNPLYTHPFTLTPSSSPKSYTIDIQKGQVVHRFFGAEISELAADFDKNKMVFKPKISARGSFIVREIEAITGSGPYNIEFKTNYDPSPTTGLVASDIIRVLKADGTTIDCAVASIVDGANITTSTNVSSADEGDFVYLRAATPSYSLLAPFLWARTEFRFADTASNAISASQVRQEVGSTFNLMWKFEDEKGAPRSGSFDPAGLPRTIGDVELTLKQFFDTPEDMNRFLTQTAKALVIRCFSGDAHELRITINSLKFVEYPTPLKSGDLVYAESKAVPVWNASDGQGFDVKVINALSSI